MQEYRDGSFGEIKSVEEIKELFKPENQKELDKTIAIHFGTKEELQMKKELAEIVRYYGETMFDIKQKLDMIIKHFKIFPIIGK